MMVLGLGDIVFCLFGWGGGGSKLESPGAGLYLSSFSFSLQEKQTRIGVLFCLLRFLSINLPAKREYFQR